MTTMRHPSTGVGRCLQTERRYCAIVTGEGRTVRAAAAWVLVVLVAACDSRLAVEQAVARIGPSKLVEAAESLRAAGAGSAVNVPIPEREWPEAIRRLEPQAVHVGAQGVLVRLESRFTTEAGVLIPFAGESVATEPGRDPAYVRLADGIYWYEIKG